MDLEQKQKELWLGWQQLFQNNTMLEIWTNVDILNLFCSYYAQLEGFFFKKIHRQGISLDGINCHYGWSYNGPRSFTAASKECLDIMTVVQVLAGKPLTVSIWKTAFDIDESQLIDSVLSFLKSKLQSYLDFQTRYPGYGGFLPWIGFEDGQWYPYQHSVWENRVPALDNSEWMWALYTLIPSLKRYDVSLARRYQEYFDTLIYNCRTIFWDDSGKFIRAEAGIKSHTISCVQEDNYYNYREGYVLDDPFEGILMYYMMVLQECLTDDEQSVFLSKKRVIKHYSRFGLTYKSWPDYAFPDGSIHTKWAQIMIPELDLDSMRLLSWRQECIRSHQNLCGLSSAALANQEDYETYNPKRYTPYGSWSLIQLEKIEKECQLTYNKGMAWLLHSLRFDEMRSPWGIGESFQVDSHCLRPTQICYSLTFDVKGFIWLALSDGIVKECRDRLKQDNLYKPLLRIIENVFEPILEELTCGYKDQIQSAQSNTYIPF